MDAAGLQTLFRFNTFANEGVRQALLASDEELLRKPLDGYWFDSVFTLLTHAANAERLWLARISDEEVAAGQLKPDELTTQTLVDAWRGNDEEWERWAATATPEALDRIGTWRRSDGKLYEIRHWQVAAHVATHSTNHRGHATVAMTALGIKHGPQEFLDQLSALPS